MSSDPIFADDSLRARPGLLIAKSIIHTFKKTATVNLTVLSSRVTTCATTVQRTSFRNRACLYLSRGQGFLTAINRETEEYCSWVKNYVGRAS